VPQLTDVERELQALSTELQRLEAAYNMFFAGRLPRPPLESRSRVDAIFKRLERAAIEGVALRFRYSTLQARYAAFADLWERGLRAREEGRAGPFSARRSAPSTPAVRVLHVASFSDPAAEMDRVQQLYEALADARRVTGESAIPFHRFTEMVRQQVSDLRATGAREVAFRLAEKDGKVLLTAKAVRERENGGAGRGGGQARPHDERG
jgi:hypothetical protein